MLQPTLDWSPDLASFDQMKRPFEEVSPYKSNRFCVICLQSEVLFFFLSVLPDYGHVESFQRSNGNGRTFWMNNHIIDGFRQLTNTQKNKNRPTCALECLCVRLEVSSIREQCNCCRELRSSRFLSEQKVRLELGCINFPKV